MRAQRLESRADVGDGLGDSRLNLHPTSAPLIPGIGNICCRNRADGGRVIAEVIADERDIGVVIIGGGAAGLSAALVLTRARRRVAVVRHATRRPSTCTGFRSGGAGHQRSGSHALNA
ncbi:FAD-binding protein [Nocardia sp. NPDC057440]|uniref:FAD-binding protein n=1 Tax=Nocardia sp. NPDC057440 TaxID=3346134 RepID=UPI0036713E0A